MKLFVCILLMFSTSTVSAAWQDWSQEQQRWYVASNIDLLADWATTRDLSRRYDEGYYERNVLLGRRPSTSTVDLYFVTGLIAHYFITDWVRDSNRTMYLKIVTAVEAGAAANNISIGLRLRF